MNNFRNRTLRKHWESLGIQSERGKAFHAFRHFNTLLMDALCIPMKVRKERIGHAFSGDFTLDVYGGKPEWSGNVDAARKMGAAIEQAVLEAEQSGEVKSIVSLTAIKEKGLQTADL